MNCFRWTDRLNCDLEVRSSKQKMLGKKTQENRLTPPSPPHTHAHADLVHFHHSLASSAAYLLENFRMVIRLKIIHLYSLLSFCFLKVRRWNWQLHLSGSVMERCLVVGFCQYMCFLRCNLWSVPVMLHLKLELNSRVGDEILLSWTGK